MNFHVVTIFPESLKSYIETSMLRKAVERKKVRINFYNPRDLTDDAHHTVDGTPYGGGAGMVLKAEPILKTVEKIKLKIKNKRSKIIILSAKGKQFTQKLARDWQKKYGHVVLIAGRYEGIDERVKTVLKAEEISVGPYVLTDGELPAGLIISAVSRLVPGVIKWESLEEESHWAETVSGEGKLLEYPHYTRPEVITHKGKSYRVPKVLLSGNHAKIKEWRANH